MKILLLLQLFISLILAAGPCKPNQGHSYNLFWECLMADVSESQMDFAVRIYQHISAPTMRPSPNLLISPISIYTTFSMLALGARSRTHKEILIALGLEDTVTDEELHDANRKLLQVLSQPANDMEFKDHKEVFIDESVKILPEYKQNMAQYYNASISTINFNDPENTEKTIFKLVSDRADNKKQNMVILDNARFQGKWQSEFHKENTEKRNFMLNEEKTKLVPTMHQQGMYMTYKDTEVECDVVEVPYAGNISLLVIVPKLGDIDRVVQTLTPQRIKNYFSFMKTSMLDLYLPKVSFKDQFSLKYIMSLMGMESLFSSEDADFSGISEDGKIQLINIYHQSSTNIEELEAVASGVTDTRVHYNLNLNSNPEFKADRPFLMLIYHKVTQTILWIGRVTNPPSAGLPGEEEGTNVKRQI
ncbi:serine protease inhibitor A6-like [Lithobates pipiens]